MEFFLQGRDDFHLVLIDQFVGKSFLGPPKEHRKGKAFFPFGHSFSAVDIDKLDRFEVSGIG